MAYRKYSSLIAGTVAGLRFTVKSFEPSLMPRSAVDQGLITAGSFLTGFLAGSTIGRTVGVVPVLATSPALRFAGLAVSGVRSAQAARARTNATAIQHTPAGAWIETGGELVGAMSVADLSTGSQMVPARRATFAAVGVASAMDLQVALDRRSDTPTAAYVGKAIGVAVAANAAVVVLGGFIFLGSVIPRRSFRSRTVGVPAGVVGGTATVASIVAAGRFAATKAIAAIESASARTEVRYSTPPAAATVSGSAFSLIPFTTLGLQGRRLVSDVTTADVIEQVTGAAPMADPVRAYVGMASATTDDDLVELAVHELRRAGGFDRSTIIAASPAGTGYVNYIAIEAAELLARGDVATVAVQYGGLPSMLSLSRVPRAASIYGHLLERLREEIDRLDRDIQLVAYGESLGALTSQMGVDAVSSPDELIVDAALWVGTPYGSALFERLTVADSVPVFDHFEQFMTQVDSHRPAVTFLNHDNDPVTKFTPSMAYSMPEWLRKTDRGRGTNPYQRWLPGIAFFQGLIDTKNAATVVPGEFESTGHDYRADLARFVAASFGFTDVSDEQMEAIEAHLRRSEVRRADAIAQGTIPPG